MAVRWVDTEVDRARWRSTVNYRVIPTLQVGVEINPGVSEVGPLFTWFLLREGHRSPAMFLGTSSDRIGTDEGRRSYYLTVAKAAPRTPLAGYVSLNRTEADDGWNVPFGLTLGGPGNLALRGMYDGERSHLLLEYAREGWSVTALSAWLERLGLAAAFGL